MIATAFAMPFAVRTNRRPAVMSLTGPGATLGSPVVAEVVRARVEVVRAREIPDRLL
ncbi:MAG TPA: hypothetical protein VKT99_22715 [Xanthobacteraceae bacterium]|jgi:hypothetical protein|nr:hypothetical protein [Xanthobacteraceae bacterium]